MDRRQGQSGRVRKIPPQPGFDPWIVYGSSESLYRLSYPGSVCSTNRMILPYVMDASRREHKASLWKEILVVNGSKYELDWLLNN